MRSILGISLLLLETVLASAQIAGSPTPFEPKNLQTAYCPQTHQLEAEPSQKFFLDGAIGKRHVRMYLDRGGAGVVGLFFDIGANWEVTLLGGTRNNDVIDASDAADDHPATAHLNASLAADHLTGTWTPSGSNQPEPAELAVIPEPRCDGKEAWKRFKNPDWPVTLSYPSSWHLEQSDDGSIILACPNPAAIAFGEQISIHHGTGAPGGPTHMVQCGKSWIYGDSCDCSAIGSHACPEAKISILNSTNVLDVSEQEHRIYCRNGGYVAAGEGQDRIILLGDRWLEINAPADSSEIINRIAASLTPDKKTTPR